MAVYDRDEHKIVVRVVYDGAAQSGKTTNIEHVCASFTTRKRGELVVPEQSGGRTQFFDWLQLDSGLVGGFPLRCQLVTVPGQLSLLRRRRYLLRAADVVVIVCDSSQEGIDDGRRSLGALRSVLAERTDEDPRSRGIPLVLQANKQDLGGALEPDEVREALGLSPDVATTAACASQGFGVRETLVLAIRAAANQLQRTLLERGVDVLQGMSETADELYDALQAAEALTLADYDTPTEPTTTEPETEARAPDGKPPDNAPDHPVELAAQIRRPTFPHPMVPSGFIWPGTTGRDILRLLEQEAPKERRDLVGQQGLANGSGTSDLHVYEAGRWFLKTSQRRRYVDVDRAREALLQLARKKVSLGDLLPPETVLSLQPEPGGAIWLWTLAPVVTTLRGSMLVADRAGDETALCDQLSQFATAVVDCLLMARRKSIVLDVHPGNFALVDRRVTYIDDDIDTGTSIPLIGHLILQRVQEFEHRPAVVATYLDALESEMRDRLAWDDMLELELPDALRSAPARSRVVRDARDRLTRAAIAVMGRP